jgi:hypothetical protein
VAFFTAAHGVVGSDLIECEHGEGNVMALYKFEQDVTRLFGSMGATDVDEFFTILADAAEIAKSGTGTTEERLRSLAKLIMEQSRSYEVEVMREQALKDSQRRREIAAWNSSKVRTKEASTVVDTPVEVAPPKPKPLSKPRHPVAAETIVLESESSRDPFARQDEEFLATPAEV